jgi:hypothetical protein
MIDQPVAHPLVTPAVTVIASARLPGTPPLQLMRRAMRSEHGGLSGFGIGNHAARSLPSHLTVTVALPPVFQFL